ncbi:MAG: Gfo/Idh/MocA family oxidoreductase [Gammaproteobacteria bacterium]|nr:Gfo/Idh/MocA family oxidoreductase [Gammaproteobacteria bacterium]
MKWKIAICGLGAAAHEIHLPAYKKVPSVEVVGGCDPRVDGGDFPFPVFDSVDKMIDRVRPDILSVVTPPSTHFELAAVGLESGCHVLCEKPFMPTMDQADQIVKLSEKVGRHIVVNNQYRFMNIHEAAKHCIGTPEFGDLLFLSASQTFFVSEHTEDGWRGSDPQRTCKEFGIHVLDLARYYFGEDPTAVYARMPKGKHPEGPDYLNLIQLEFSGDRVALISLDRLSRGPHRYLDIRLDGSEAVVETSLGGKMELNAGIRGGTRRPYAGLDVSLGGRARLYRGEKYRKLASDPLDLFAHATSKLMAAFVEALKRGTTPPCNGADNKRTLALVFAAYESGARNEPVIMQYQ